MLARTLVLLVVLGAVAASSEKVVCKFVSTAYGNATGTAELVFTGSAVSLSLNVSGVSAASSSAHQVFVTEFGNVLASDGSGLGLRFSPFDVCNTSLEYLLTWNASNGAIDETRSLTLLGGLSLNETSSVVGRGLIIMSTDNCSLSTDTPVGFCVLGISNNAAPTVVTGLTSSGPMVAVAKIAPVGNTGVSGFAWFQQATAVSDTFVTIRVDGLVNGSRHGVHIHQWGEWGVFGTHYNPTGMPHSIPSSAYVRHLGDLGNLYHYESGTAWYRYQFTGLNLFGSFSPIGRSIAVHSNPDSCVQPTGNGGAIMAAGIIGLADSTVVPQGVPGSVPTTQPITDCPTGMLFCRFHGTSNDPDVFGSATLSYAGVGWVKLELSVFSVNNPSADHGVHIHQFGDQSIADGSSMGSHWNPTNVAHGCPSSSIRHVGDTGNWRVDNNAILFGERFLSGVSLSGADSIVGRGIVVHALPDNCITTNSSGLRLATCVFGLPNSAPNLADGSSVLPAWPAKATAFIRSTPSFPGINGLVEFYQQNASAEVEVFARITGLVNRSVHGFHVYTFGDYSVLNGSKLGEHFNPWNVSHGIPGSGDFRHAGDLGNVHWYDASGTAYFYLSSNTLTLNGSRSILGRAVVLDENEDDCSQPNGNAGNKAAFGIIGLAQSSSVSIAFPAGVNKANIIFTGANCVVSAGTTGDARLPPTAPVPPGTEVVDGSCAQLDGCDACVAAPDCVWCEPTDGEEEKSCVEQGLRESCKTYYFGQCSVDANALGTPHSYIIILVVLLFIFCCLVPVIIFLSCRHCECCYCYVEDDGEGGDDVELSGA